MKRIFTLQFVLFLFISSFIVNSTNGQTYCNPSMNCLSGNYFYILNVTIGTVNNSAGATNCAGHNYLATAGDTITLSAGVSTSMSVSTNYDQGLGIYVDLNSNGNFGNTGELLYSAAPSNVYGSSYTDNFTISVPSNTPTGYYRLRVLAPYSGTPSATTSCPTTSLWYYGTWQDYTLYVSGPPVSPPSFP